MSGTGVGACPVWAEGEIGCSRLNFDRLGLFILFYQ